MKSEFFECIKQAELKSNMTFVIEGNELKRKSEETKQDLHTLRKQLSKLNEETKQDLHTLKKQLSELNDKKEEINCTLLNGKVF